MTFGIDIIETSKKTTIPKLENKTSLKSPVVCENESNLCQPIGSDVQPLNTPMVDVGEGHDET